MPEFRNLGSADPREGGGVHGKGRGSAKKEAEAVGGGVEVSVSTINQSRKPLLHQSFLSS